MMDEPTRALGGGVCKTLFKAFPELEDTGDDGGALPSQGWGCRHTFVSRNISFPSHVTLARHYLQPSNMGHTKSPITSDDTQRAWLWG